MSTDQSVIVWGEVLIDRFPDGDKLGGAPANCAYHIGQAGGWVRLASRVGDDADGRWATEKLGYNVDTSLVQIDRERATGEVQVTLDGGEARYKLVSDRAWERIACTDDVVEAIREAGVFVYGTLSQRTPAGLAAWTNACVAASTGCFRVCDLNLRPNDNAGPAILPSIEAADLLKLNDKELVALRDWFGWTDPLEMLRERPRIIALTHGAEGSTLFGPRGVIEVPAVPAAPGGDNVGCGDAYLAILVHGLTLGWDLETSGRAAARWAAAVAGVRGATPDFSDDEIDDLLELS
jgi:fructokinase